MLGWFSLVAFLFAVPCIQADVSAGASKKVCYAYFSSVTDLGWTYSINLGRAWVDAMIGSTSTYVENVGFMSPTDQKAVFEDFLISGCKVVVVGTITVQELAWDYAIRNPEVRFICLQCTPRQDMANYASVDIRLEQAGYIAGRVAASEASVKSIGYVASDYVSPSFRNINSFALGALSVQPNITLKIVHTGSWFSPRKERIAAMRLIEQHGVDLLAYDSDATTVLQVARDMKKQSIAVKVDGTAAYGESNLLSRVYVWDIPLEETIAAALDLRNWTLHRRDNEFVGFEKNAVSLGTFSTSVDVPARISSQEIVQRFKTEGDFTFCIGSQGIKAFCPRDANISSPELGDIPANVFPCHLPDGVVMPEEGDCLSDKQQRSMTWLVQEFEDLGLLDVPDLCPLGTRMDYHGSELCVPCDPGHISSAIDAAQCEACPAGTFAVNGVECRKCTAGTFSNASSSVNCTACPAGTYGEADGQMECTPCGAGYFASSLGQISCEYCAVGSYNDGSADALCLSCPEGETTEFRAATSMSECICPAGQYRDEAGACRGCPPGMLCDLGSDVRNVPPAVNSSCAPGFACTFPRTLPKYMTLPDKPLLVYECIDDSACPGGSVDAVSTCGSHRAIDEIACGLCAENAYSTSDDTCEECNGRTDVLIFGLVILGAVLALAALVFAVNRDLLLQRNGTASIIILGGVFVTALQTVLVFNQLSLEWVDPMLTLMKFATLFSLDLRRLKTECYLPVSPTSRLAGRQMVAPACLPILFIIIGLKKLRVGVKVNLWSEVGNTAGTLFSIFYISVVTSAVTPFVCYPHPTDDAGYSMVNDPAVLCWHDDERHLQLVAVAVISFLLVPAAFLGVCVYAVLQYPTVMANHSDTQQQWLLTYRFLFFRFKPEAYAYGVANLMRNLLICVLPAVIPGDSVGIQILLLVSLLLGFLVMQSCLQPWRTQIANLVDSLTSVVLVLTLVTGLIATNVDVSKADLGILGTLVLSLGLVGLLIGAVAGARDSHFPGKQYSFFLCHHKAAAAAQVRILQILVAKKLHKTCFLDSDNLKDLDKLFETVKGSVAHFVIYLTKDTLTRPWCVGEVVVAKEARLPVTRIKHPSYEAPTMEQLQDIENYVAPGVKFADYNMDTTMISTALRWMVCEELPTIDVWQSVRTNHGLQVFHDIVMQFRGGGTQRRKSVKMGQTDTLIISSDPEDLEATAASGIVFHRIHAEAASLIQGEIIVLADHGATLPEKDLLRCVAGARAALVVLSEHSLHCLQQLHVILAAGAGDISVIAVSTPAFVFPSDSYYGLILPNVLSPITDDIQRTVKSFFAQIALPLSTHASDRILQAECMQIVSRIPLEQAKLQKAVMSLELPFPKNRIVSPAFSSSAWSPTPSETHTLEALEARPTGSNLSMSSAGEDYPEMLVEDFPPDLPGWKYRIEL